MSRNWRLRTEWEQLARISGYSCNGVAAILNISVRELQRYFSGAFSVRPHHYFRHLRMSDARILLNGTLLVYEIATFLAYKDVPHFCHDFRSFHGKSPNKFPVNPQQFEEAHIFEMQYRELLEEYALEAPNTLSRLPAKQRVILQSR